METLDITEKKEEEAKPVVPVIGIEMSVLTEEFKPLIAVLGKRNKLVIWSYTIKLEDMLNKVIELGISEYVIAVAERDYKLEADFTISTTHSSYDKIPTILV